MKIHLTGSRGFVARWLKDELGAAGHELSGSELEDAYNPELWLDHLSRPELVVHLGALVGRVRGSQRSALDLNVWSTHVWAQACAQRRIRFLYVSSSECYEPRNVYGLTKRWGEDCCRLAFEGQLEHLQIARLAMPYGPGHPPGNGRAALVNFLDLARRNETLTVHDGATRSWCWIGDTVHGLRRLLESSRSVLSFDDGVVDVGRNDNVTSMLDVARRAVALTASSSEIEIVPCPPDYSLEKRVDATPLRLLGFKPQVELEEGMRRTLSWLEGREYGPKLREEVAKL